MEDKLWAPLGRTAWRFLRRKAALEMPVAVPDLDELADDPAKAMELPLSVAQAILAKTLALNTALLAVIAKAPRGGYEVESTEAPDFLISVEQTAKLLGMRPRWIYDHKDELPFVIHNGRSLRCSHRGVMRYIREKRGL